MDLYIIYNKTKDKALRIETDLMRAIQYTRQLSKEFAGDEFSVCEVYLKTKWCDL
jgi:hypothetical protein